jgi:type I restriction enzyme S subunit
MAEIAPLVRRSVDVHADAIYREIGIRSFAKGVFHKRPTTGLEIGGKRVFSIVPGDLLFNIVFAWEGAVAVASAAEEGTIGSHRFLTCTVNADVADAHFLFWWFSRGEGREQLLRASPGGAGRNRTLGVDKLAAIHVPTPPLPEQRRIAAQLNDVQSKIDEAIRLRREASEALVALRRSASSAILGAFPATGKLLDVLHHLPRNGWSPRCDQTPDGTPVLTLSAVTGWQYDPRAFKRTSEPTTQSAHYWLDDGDLLITRSNTPELVGHVAIYSGQPTPCIYPDLMMKISVDPAKACAAFVWHWMQTTTVRDYIRRSAKGTSSTMKKISQGVVAGTPFPVDISVSEQMRLVEKLDGFAAQVNALKQLQMDTEAELGALLPATVASIFREQGQANAAA